VGIGGLCDEVVVGGIRVDVVLVVGGTGVVTIDELVVEIGGLVVLEGTVMVVKELGGGSTIGT
jgi:hypothetical protein